MNLVSHLEEHKMMFYYVSAVIVALMAGLGFGAMSKMSRDNIL